MRDMLAEAQENRSIWEAPARRTASRPPEPDMDDLARWLIRAVGVGSVIFSALICCGAGLGLGLALAQVLARLGRM